jgi:V/A-type H+-transporting ATPase subunit D
MNLLRMQRRLERVDKGIELLRRKREALVSELFQRARPAVDAREVIVEVTAEAYPALVRALASHGQTGLRALGWPTRELEVEMAWRKVWGLAVSDILERPTLGRTLGARATPPASAGPAAEAAATQFEILVDLLLNAAPKEMLIRRLGQALAQTSRQVNTLDRRIAPELDSQIAAIRGTLEEREREEHLRLKHLGRLRQRAPTP